MSRNQEKKHVTETCYMENELSANDGMTLNVDHVVYGNMGYNFSKLKKIYFFFNLLFC